MILRARSGWGAFGGYGFGVGDRFEDIEIDMAYNIVEESSMGFTFGGQIMYGFSPKFAFALVWDWIQWKYDISGDTEMWFGETDIDDEYLMKFNTTLMYFFDTKARFCPFVEAGPGFYINSHEEADNRFGITAGAGALYFFQPVYAIEFGGRFHHIFDSEDAPSEFAEDIPSTSFFELFVGFKYFFGRWE